MPIDSVLFRFAGEETVEQSQSAPLLPVSSAMPSPAADHYFFAESITGNYPIPGIVLDSMCASTTDWEGATDFKLDIYTKVDHATGLYRISLYLNNASGTSIYYWSMSGQSITIPAGYTAADTIPVVFYVNQFSRRYVRLYVTPADMVAGSQSYSFTVPGFNRRTSPDITPHTGAWMSQYAIGYTTTMPSPLGGMDHFLQLISFRGPSAPSVSVELDSTSFRVSSGAASTELPSALSTNGVKYLSAISADGMYVVTARLDVEAARKTVFVQGNSATRYTADNVGQLGSINNTNLVPAAKNSMFPKVYKGILATRGCYIHNISSTEKTVGLLRLASHANLGVSLASLASSGAAFYWTVGDGTTTGVPSFFTTSSRSSLATTSPAQAIVIPAGAMAGVVLSYEYFGTTDTESLTTIGVVVA